MLELLQLKLVSGALFAPRVPLGTLLFQALQELQHEFGRYEEALCQNNVKELDLLFHKSPETVRYGVSENLYGYEAIQAFRGARAPPGQREILRSALTTYGSDLGVTHIEFQRDGSRRVGRQTQTWLRSLVGRTLESAVSGVDRV
ncbi:unnamed protein product [Durusdinium trenchii]|uniref:Uncharacterized protein n=1 Tax=Durusdinium trenchii TaxID=1381693 RepID=A0ABP0N7E6_9DINO